MLLIGVTRFHHDIFEAPDRILTIYSRPAPDMDIMNPAASESVPDAPFYEWQPYSKKVFTGLAAVLTYGFPFKRLGPAMRRTGFVECPLAPRTAAQTPRRFPARTQRPFSSFFPARGAMSSSKTSRWPP